MNIVKVKFPITQRVCVPNKQNLYIGPIKSKSKAHTLHQNQGEEHSILKTKTSNVRSYVADIFQRKRQLDKQLDLLMNTQRNINLQVEQQKLQQQKLLTQYDNDPQLQATNYNSQDEDCDQASPINNKRKLNHAVKSPSITKRPQIEVSFQSKLQEGKNFPRSLSLRTIMKSKSLMKVKQLLSPKSQIQDFHFSNISKNNSRLHLSPRILSQLQSTIEIPTFLDDEIPKKKKHYALNSMLVVKKINMFDEMIQEKLNTIIAKNLDHASLKQCIDTKTFSFQLNKHHRMPRIQENYLQHDTYFQHKKFQIVKSKHLIIAEQEKSPLINMISNLETMEEKQPRYKDVKNQGMIDQCIQQNPRSLSQTQIIQSHNKIMTEAIKPYYGDLIQQNNDCLNRENPIKSQKRSFLLPDQLGFQDNNEINEIEDYFLSYVKTQTKVL